MWRQCEWRCCWSLHTCVVRICTLEWFEIGKLTKLFDLSNHFHKKTQGAQGLMGDLDVFGPIQVQKFKAWYENTIWNRDGTDIFRGPISAVWALTLQSLASRCLQQGNVAKTFPTGLPIVMSQTFRKGDGFSSSPMGDFVKTFKTTGSDKYFLMRRGATDESKLTFLFF